MNTIIHSTMLALNLILLCANISLMNRTVQLRQSISARPARLSPTLPYRYRGIPPPAAIPTPVFRDPEATEHRLRQLEAQVEMQRIRNQVEANDRAR